MYKFKNRNVKEEPLDEILGGIFAGLVILAVPVVVIVVIISLFI